MGRLLEKVDVFAYGSMSDCFVRHFTIHRQCAQHFLELSSVDKVVMFVNVKGIATEPSVSVAELFSKEEFISEFATSAINIFFCTNSHVILILCLSTVLLFLRYSQSRSLMDWYHVLYTKRSMNKQVLPKP